MDKVIESKIEKGCMINLIKEFYSSYYIIMKEF